MKYTETTRRIGFSAALKLPKTDSSGCFGINLRFMEVSYIILYYTQTTSRLGFG